VSGKNASWNKKSIDGFGYESEKSARRMWNKNVSVASAPEKNVSKSVSSVCSGMSRSNTSENDAWHVSKNAWPDEHLSLQPIHRLSPRYSLTARLSRLFPSRLSYKPTRENGSPTV